MSIKWCQALETGIPWQDAEHKQIVERISELLDAMNRHEANAVIADLFTFLESYARDHFGHEEQFMQEVGDPTYAWHRECHLEFVRHYQELHSLWTRQGASTYVTMHVQRWLREWLLDHIGRVDKQMSLWLRAREREAKA